MSKEETLSWGLRRKALFGFAVLFFLIAVILFGFRMFITTDAGHRFLENQINKRSFGPIQSVSVSGLSGDPLGNLRVESLKVKDKEGEWLNASDIRLKWRPFSLVSKHLDISSAFAKQVNVLRRPTLSSAKSSGALPQFSAPDISIALVSLENAVFGQASRFSINSGVTYRNDETKLDLKLVRADATEEVLEVQINHAKSGDVQGNFELIAPSGGPIAALLRAPDGKDIIGKGQITGTELNGVGKLSIRVGDAEAIELSLNWTPERGLAEAKASLDAWPELLALTEALGSNLSVTVELKRNSVERPFELKLQSAQAQLSAQGNLPKEGFKVSRASVRAQVNQPAKLGLFPDGYGAAAVELSGIASTTPANFDGAIIIASPDTPFAQASKVTGPLRISQRQDQTLSFDTTITAEGLNLSQTLPFALQDVAVLSASGRYDSSLQRLNLSEAKLISGLQSFSSGGELSLSPLEYALTGVTNLKLKPAEIAGMGTLLANYNLMQTDNSGPALTAAGSFIPDASFAEPLNSLLGAEVKFETRMQPIEGGVKITEARLSGDYVRAAFEGSIAEALNLSGEALTTQAFIFGGAEVGERAELSLWADGSRDSPNVKLQSAVSSLSVAGQLLEDIEIKADVSDMIEAPSGAVMISGLSDYGAVQAQAALSSDGRDITLADITLGVGDLLASGDLVYSERGLFTGDLALNLPEDDDSFARASLRLSEASGVQGVRANVNARNIAYQAFDVDRLNLEATGTLSELVGEIALKGRRNVGAFARPIEVNAPFSAARDDDGAIVAKAEPKGRYASLDFASREAVQLISDGEALSFSMPIMLTGEPIDLRYIRRSSANDAPKETLMVNANNLPISLFPLPGNLADSRGLVSLEADFQSGNGSELGGDVVLSINDWRGFGVDAGQGLFLVLTAEASPGKLDTVLEGQSNSSFSVVGNLSVPLNTNVNLSAVRPNMNSPIKGTLRAAGPAEALLGLITPPSADLGGTVDLSIDMSGNLSEPRVVGNASGRSLQFETPELGTQIRNGRFKARFNNTELSVSDIYFTDTKDGVVEGDGKFILGEFGRPIGELSVSTTKFNVIDRRDISARISGNARYQSEVETATISGAIKVGEAELKQIASGSDVSVIEIEVDEINRPDGLNEKTESERPSVSTNLDIKLKAPRRVFVRSKGLDVELSADMTLTGTLENPIVKGSAAVERGGYKIAGKELKFTEGSVQFDGPLGEARVSLKANAQTSNLNASVAISGTVADPEIKLSSSPERPDDEILSALLFGRSATELSTIEAAQLAGALAQFSGNGVGFDLLGGLRDSIGIGQLSVGVSEDGNAQITGGRYLARNVYLQVFSGVGAEQTGAIIDWELRENISLRSRIQADNDQSLSLSYKYDF